MQDFQKRLSIAGNCASMGGSTGAAIGCTVGIVLGEVFGFV